MIENAESITASGQLINKWTHKRVNELLDTIIGTEGSNRTVAGDTDSVGGETVIEINGKKMTIADFYNMCPSDFIRRDEFNSDYVKRVAGCVSPSVNTKFEVEYKPVKYVMKHKVKKRMFRIEANGKSVDVTEDHSIMVERSGELLSVKPEQITGGDKIIMT